MRILSDPKPIPDSPPLTAAVIGRSWMNDLLDRVTAEVEYEWLECQDKTAFTEKVQNTTNPEFPEFITKAEKEAAIHAAWEILQEVQNIRRFTEIPENPEGV